MASAASSVCLHIPSCRNWDLPRPWKLERATYPVQRHQHAIHSGRKARTTNHWACVASSQNDIESAEQVESLVQLDKDNSTELVKEEEEKPYIGRALRMRKGEIIADLLEVFGNLLERPYGGGESVANAGAVVIEKLVSDTVVLQGQEGVSDQVVFELLKTIKLLEMDMDLVRAAQKEETLLERLATAQAHCKQAFLIADSIE